jgi:hypothetical protein
VLVGVFAGFFKSKNNAVPRGAEIMAYTDLEGVLRLPLAGPPPEA